MVARKPWTMDHGLLNWWYSVLYFNIYVLIALHQTQLHRNIILIKKRDNNGAFWYETNKRKTLMYLSETILLATALGVADCGWESEEWGTIGECRCWVTEANILNKEKISSKNWTSEKNRKGGSEREREREGYALLPLVEQVRERGLQRLNQGCNKNSLWI